MSLTVRPERGVTIEDTDQIRYIVENIQSIPMHRSEVSLRHMGYGFQISYIDACGGDVVPVFFLNSDNTIGKKPFLYRCDGGLCFEELKKIEAEILSQVPSLRSIAQSSDRRIEELLTGFSAEDIHEKWGEPDGELFGFRADVYPFPDGDEVLFLYYDAQGIVERIKTDYRNRDDFTGQAKSAQNVETRQNRNEQFSVGIIGGADGPTAIFVTGSDGPAVITAGYVNRPKMIAAVCASVVLIGLLSRLRKRGGLKNKKG